MSHTFTKIYVHAIFSTAARAPLIVDDIRDSLHAYLGGIVRQMGGTAVAVGGTADHVHMLLDLPSGVSLAECMRVVKTNSSKWVHLKWPAREFEWQRGYGGFTVSASARQAVTSYIAGQEGHHARVSFEEEFRAFLRKHGVRFEEGHIFD